MTEKLWGGRFEEDITPDVLDYTLTTDIDVRLVFADLWQDIAHVLMLSARDIIPETAARSILGSLLALQERSERGELNLRPEFEDVHLNIEQMVIEDLGREVGGHMHTARSRNDQVSTDTRMYLRRVQLESVRANLALIDTLLSFPEEDLLAILPGYTHSQAAQPVSVAFWKTAHASMLLRDVRRLRGAYDRTDESPLGACALAGTSFPLDRQVTARLLGFGDVLSHALDATSARDYLIESASAFAIGGNNLSRMAEEVVVWSGHEYSLCEVPDAYATGSSIMPQKKNPVVAELARGRAGRTVGTLVQLLTMAKGVTLGYSCDLQDDKPYLWNAIDTYLSTLKVIAGQTRGLTFDSTRGEDLCWDNFSTATELANYLVSDHGIAFREAHHISGSLVSALLKRGSTLRDTALGAEILAELGHPVEEAVLARIFAPRNAVTSYTSPGGTSPDSVRDVRDELRRTADAHRRWCADTEQKLDDALRATLRAAREVAGGADAAKVLATVVAELPPLTQA
ncbi:argininosuccinate lyase [Kitasatospora herbaricolor]|uniref:argininosuccinate lyase n=1 Tax=Kitasatospora herbaricolor TaxID=68217 RepID=UPI00174E9F42|nr:argininosuccinate lyase [Kitasatospora herbaricolor]MDQ0309539.1 argininosuccinate lyase [Kitasatospora herbaricolor]GGV01178.1 argininosuccinate lyase [Kitasatospora herbaricolor]